MDQLSAIHQQLQPELNEMNAIILESLATSNQLMNKVVTNYLTVKGKQIRPIMVILSAKFFGSINEHVIHAGAALEMLHNATLIHDDVVDDTSMRRGRNTVNNDWGNQIAVLVGDFFVSNALAVGIKTGILAIISSLSDLGKELSLGEVDQICNVREHCFDENHYIDMIRKKTASLFKNCVKMGAEAIGVSVQEYTPLMHFAENLGICFQIRDDIFDYTQSSLIGKPTGNDLREGKVTLPLLYALKNGDKNKAEEMKQILFKGDLTEQEIESLINFAVEEGGIDYAMRKMKEIQKTSAHYLDVYPESEWKTAFQNLFDYIISRDR